MTRRPRSRGLETRSRSRAGWGSGKRRGDVQGAGAHAAAAAGAGPRRGATAGHGPLCSPSPSPFPLPTGVPALAGQGCAGEPRPSAELQQSGHRQHVQHRGLHRGALPVELRTSCLVPLQQGTATPAASWASAQTLSSSNDLARLPTCPRAPAPRRTVAELPPAPVPQHVPVPGARSLLRGTCWDRPSPGLGVYMALGQQHPVPQGAGSTRQPLPQPWGPHCPLTATLPLPSPSPPGLPAGCSEHADQVPVPALPGGRHPLRRSPPRLGANRHGERRITKGKRTFGRGLFGHSPSGDGPWGVCCGLKSRRLAGLRGAPQRVMLSGSLTGEGHER